jgi:hypothetical protein
MNETPKGKCTTCGASLGSHFPECKKGVESQKVEESKNDYRKRALYAETMLRRIISAYENHSESLHEYIILATNLVGIESRHECEICHREFPLVCIGPCHCRCDGSFVVDSV